MTTYTVQPGDWVSKVALKIYGSYLPINGWDPVKAIAAANPQISNINVISAGQVLNIPDKPGTASTANTASSVTQPSNAMPASTGTNWQKVGIYALVILAAAGAAIGLNHKMKKSKKSNQNGN